MLEGVIAQKVKVTTSTLCVILALNCAYKMNKSAEGITIPAKIRREFLVDRHTVYSTLAQLEKAGYIKIGRKRGQALQITLLLVPSDKNNSKKGGHI